MQIAIMIIGIFNSIDNELKKLNSILNDNDNSFNLISFNIVKPSQSRPEPQG